MSKPNVSVASERKSFFNRLKSSQQFYAFLALVLLILFFGILAGDRFLSYAQFLSVLDVSYYVGFMAIGVTFVIITSGIDLSLGTLGLCSVMVGGTVAQKLFGSALAKNPDSAFIAALVALAFGALMGAFNGFLVARLKLPAFIATLGTQMITIGFSSIVNSVQPINFPSVNTNFMNFMNKIKVSGANGDFYIPTGLIFFILIIVVSHIILKKTKIGRYTYAIGSNKEAVRLSGVNVEKWETIPYIISGFCAAFGGVMYAATYVSIKPGMGGGFELDAIAGVVVGGTSLAGGVGSISGTVIGVLIMSVLKVGLPSIGAQAHYQKFITGFIVILAVLIDVTQNNKKRV